MGFFANPAYHGYVSADRAAGLRDRAPQMQARTSLRGQRGGGAAALGGRPSESRRGEIRLGGLAGRLVTRGLGGGRGVAQQERVSVTRVVFALVKLTQFILRAAGVLLLVVNAAAAHIQAVHRGEHKLGVQLLAQPVEEVLLDDPPVADAAHEHDNDGDDNDNNDAGDDDNRQGERLGTVGADGDAVAPGPDELLPGRCVDDHHLDGEFELVSVGGVEAVGGPAFDGVDRVEREGGVEGGAGDVEEVGRLGLPVGAGAAGAHPPASRLGSANLEQVRRGLKKK